MSELPEKIRTFVAIYPPEKIVDELQAVQARLQQKLRADSVRWTMPEQIHLTLQFLGYVKRESLERFQSALEFAANEKCCFQIRAETIGCFPNAKHPRIIWAGLTGESDSLQTLKQRLDVAFSELGSAPEVRKFHPHLTIGRVGDLNSSETKLLVTEISKFQSTRFGEWPVREIHLIQSVLSSKGAKYRILKSFPLKTFKQFASKAVT